MLGVWFLKITLALGNRNHLLGVILSTWCVRGAEAPEKVEAKNRRPILTSGSFKGSAAFGKGEDLRIWTLHLSTHLEDPMDGFVLWLQVFPSPSLSLVEYAPSGCADIGKPGLSAPRTQVLV